MIDLFRAAGFEVAPLDKALSRGACALPRPFAAQDAVRLQRFFVFLGELVGDGALVSALRQHTFDGDPDFLLLSIDSRKAAIAADALALTRDWPAEWVLSALAGQALNPMRTATIYAAAKRQDAAVLLDQAYLRAHTRANDWRSFFVLRRLLTGPTSQRELLGALSTAHPRVFPSGSAVSAAISFLLKSTLFVRKSGRGADAVYIPTWAPERAPTRSEIDTAVNTVREVTEEIGPAVDHAAASRGLRWACR